MALAALSGDAQLVIFAQLCNPLDPGVAVAFSSTYSELWTLTQAPRQQLKADHEAAAALGRKHPFYREFYKGVTPSMQICKKLREAESVGWSREGLSSDELALVGTLCSVLPALEQLDLYEPEAGLEGVQRLTEKLRAGTLPAVTKLVFGFAHAGDAGASALAAALGRGALPRLKTLELHRSNLSDAGLVALAPALRRLPALEELNLQENPFGDEGLTALVAPPPPAGPPTTTTGVLETKLMGLDLVATPPAAGAPPPPTGVLTKLKVLHLERTQINDAGCAALASALDSGALPALRDLPLSGIPASAAAKATVRRSGARAGFCVRG